MTELITILFQPINRIVTIQAGSTVLHAIREAGIQFEAICGGKGQCGKCRVIKISGTIEEDISNIEKFISKDERKSGYTLACVVRVYSNATFTIPVESRIDRPQILYLSGLPAWDLDPAVKKYLVSVVKDGPTAIFGPSITLKGYSGQKPSNFSTYYNLLNKIGRSTVTVSISSGEPKIIRLEPDDTRNSLYGMALDLGTTTVVGILVDLLSGKVIERASTLNNQITYGEELITRISYAMNLDGLAKLQKAAISSINEVINKILNKLNINEEEISDFCIGGNTVMSYLLTGIDPSPLEFVDAIIDRRPVQFASFEKSLLGNPQSMVYLLPSVSRFIGGDAIGDVITSGMHLSADISLLIDLGTNGQIILGNKDWMVSTSCASGPAFEGSGLQCGMRAMHGAIEHVHYDERSGEIHLQVIGDQRPKGICGSGIIDAAVMMAKLGILDFSGKLVEATPGVRSGREGLEYILASGDKTATGRDIVITRDDMAYLMDSKAAVCGGISVLLQKYHILPNDISKVYLAGAFGSYVQTDKLIRFGILPEFPNAVFHRIGNGSLAGAYAALVFQEVRKDADKIASEMGYVDLLIDPSFIDEYWAALRIPGKEELFPSYYKNKEL